MLLGIFQELPSEVSFSFLRHRGLEELLSYGKFKPRFAQYKVPIMFWTCYSSFFLTRIPETFTGLCTLVLALDRFVLIVLPLRSAQLLTRTNRIVVYTLLTVPALALNLFEAAKRSQEAMTHEVKNDICLLFPDIELLSFTNISHATALLFYFTPGLLSLLLYSVVSYVLLNKPTNAGRNKVLTIALMFSCIFWLLSWGVAYWLRFRSQGPSGLLFDLMKCVVGVHEEDYYEVNDEVALLISLSTPFIQVFSSLMNALCLLVICKMFWEPFLIPLRSIKNIFTRFTCNH